jgi:hypothetical protein
MAHAGEGETEGRVGCAFGAGADVDAELQGERSTVGGGWDDTNRRTDTSARGTGVAREVARHTASAFVSGDSEGCAFYAGQPGMDW